MSPDLTLEISSLLLASSAAQPGLCLTWAGTLKTGYLMTETHFNIRDYVVDQTKEKISQICEMFRSKFWISMNLAENFN